LNVSRVSINRLLFLSRCGIVCLTFIVLGCGSESVTPDMEVELTTAAPEPAEDPLSIIPEDVSLWETFHPKRILRQPGTNTLVVEGVVAGDAATLAGELETASIELGWSADTLATNGGLTTLILSKDSRRLKVNLTQDEDVVNVYLTTRVPE